MKIKSNYGLIFLNLRNQITDKERVVWVNPRTSTTIDADEKNSPELVAFIKAGKISVIEEEDSTLEGFEGSIDTLTEDIDAINEGIDTINESIGTINEDIDTINNTLDSLSSSSTPTFAGLNITGDIINIATKKTITNANDTGIAGQICYDENYIYVCIATDTWKRAAITTWGS